MAVLRPLLRELLTELGWAAAEAVSELVRRGQGDDARPGTVVSIATAGDLLQWHPHVHLLTTDGAKTTKGMWQPPPEWDATQLMRLFRERLLARLVESHAISPQLVAKLLAWKHPGFSAHVGEPMAPEQKQRLEDTAAYLPLSLKKLVYLSTRTAFAAQVTPPSPGCRPRRRRHRASAARRVGLGWSPRSTRSTRWCALVAESA